MECVYILKTREAINWDLSIYKIGKTANVNKRFYGYPKGSQLITAVSVKNYNDCEREIIKIFSLKFIQRKDYGLEYFEGNICDIYELFSKICCKYVDFGCSPHDNLDLKTPAEDIPHNSNTVVNLKWSDLTDIMRENTPNISFPVKFGDEDNVLIKNKLGDIYAHSIENDILSAIPNLFEKIHGSKNLPEYHNIYMTREWSNDIIVSDGKSFVYEFRETFVSKIITKMRYLLDHYIEENRTHLGEKILTSYKKYQELLDTDIEFNTFLGTEIIGILLDMKSCIKYDKKQRKLCEHRDFHNKIHSKHQSMCNNPPLQLVGNVTELPKII